MNRKFKNATKFVSKHRVAIAVAVTTVVIGAMHVQQVKEMNIFLADHNLLEEFYALTDED